MKKQFNLKNPWCFLATSCGLGLSPYMPGTIGTLLAIPLYYFLQYFANQYLYLIIVLFLTPITIYIADVVNKTCSTHDNAAITIDEVIGFLYTMIFIPNTFFNIFLAFIFFRLFDILKPFPINFLDKKVKGGFGIILDDIIAAFFANICLQLILII